MVPLFFVNLLGYFLKLGLDSMALTQMRGSMKVNFDFEIEEQYLFEDDTTLRKIIQALEKDEKIFNPDAPWSTTENDVKSCKTQAVTQDRPSTSVSSFLICCSCFRGSENNQ